MRRPSGTYQPNLVREFFANYLALLEKDFPKGEKIIDMGNQYVVPMPGLNIDILEHTLNRFLFGPEYEIPGAILDLEH